MSSDGERDMWGDLVRGQARPFVDPETGEVIMEQPIVQPLRRKVADAGYVMLNMDAVVQVGRHLNMPASLILMEAARQWRMGNGAVAVTAAFCGRLGITRWQSRAAVTQLAAFADATGWVKVTKSGHEAARVQPTITGMRRLWRAGKAPVDRE